MEIRNLSIALVSAALLSACGGDSSVGSGTGKLNLELTDSPVDSAENVVVIFTGVEIKPAGGNVITFDYCDPVVNVSECKDIDLLTLQGGATTDLLNNEELPAGEYEWVRLKVYTDPTALDASYIVIKNEESQSPETHNLFIPSGDQTGLKLVSGFTIAQGSIKRLVIDFVLRKSILAPRGQAPNYLLKPTLLMFDQQDTATIVGDVDLAALGTEQAVDSCVGGFYLFDGAGATPDDQDGTVGTDPVVYDSLEVDPNSGSTVASYTIPFVDTGDEGSSSYTVAFTCNFDVDALPYESEYDPAAGSDEPGFETMNWTTTDVTVVPGATETVSFPSVTP
jgi:hypothetical protein